jgi:dolichyl-phosphate beta-glucosyltransferase
VLLPVLQGVCGEAWEIIIVDDGSTDRTAPVAEAYPHPAVRVLRTGVNQGKGAALRVGIGASTGAAVLMCDADMATPPETLKLFMEHLQGGADIVIGNRRSPLAQIVRRQSWPRRFLGTVYIFMTTRLLGVAVDDVNCGFKLFRGDVARRLFAAATAAAWTIDIEILALAAKAGCRVVEVPVVWRDGEASKVRLLKDTLMTFLQVLRLYVRLR